MNPIRKSTRNTILPLLFLGLMYSCETSDDSSMEITAIDIVELKATVQSGTWVIAKYMENSIDKTSNFSGYEFDFGSDGVLNASNQTTSLSGAWSILSDSGNDDDSSDDDIDFNIFFTSPNNFAEISEDWEIVSYSSSRIELTHTSGGDGSIGSLIFEKL